MIESPKHQHYGLITRREKNLNVGNQSQKSTKLRAMDLSSSIHWKDGGGRVGQFEELGDLLMDKDLSVDTGTGEARSGELYITILTGSFHTHRRN